MLSACLHNPHHWFLLDWPQSVSDRATLDVFCLCQLPMGEKEIKEEKKKKHKKEAQKQCK